MRPHQPHPDQAHLKSVARRTLHHIATNQSGHRALPVPVHPASAALSGPAGRNSPVSGSLAGTWTRS